MKFPPENRPVIHVRPLSKSLVLMNVAIVLFYFSWWFSPANIGQPLLYGLLFFGEIYHVLMVLLFWHTMKGLRKPLPELPNLINTPSIVVFVTVAGEPVEIVRNTVTAILAAKYRNKKVFILNDSFVAQKDNWQEYEILAAELGIECITRKRPGGAKAGNINNALRHTTSDLVAIFDADMQPYPDFFAKTVPYFADPQLGFVQTPQYYFDHAENDVTAAAWEQQEFFFGPIMRGKQANNAAFICGTNVVIRRAALDSVGGMNETSIAEDFLTSLHIHRLGWKSLYVPEVLAQGMAPGDIYSYFKQQLRWARGSVDVLFRNNPMFMKGLSVSQRLEYLSSALYYANGLIVIINMLIPILYLWTGISPINASTAMFALFFLPFIISVISSLHIISDNRMSFRAMSFTQSSWYLQLLALVSAATGKKMGFAVTPKSAQSGNFLFVAWPQIAYVAIAIVSVAAGVFREGISPAIITNASWVSFNVLLSLPFIKAALPSIVYKSQQETNLITPNENP